MDFGENNVFGLNNHIREENGNSNNNSNSNSNSFACYSWEPITSCASSSSSLINAFHTTTNPIDADSSAATRYHQPPPLYGGDGSHVHPDPNLTCLNLGKRHYFEDTTNISNAASLGERHVVGVGVGGFALLEGKRRGKAYYGNGEAAAPGRQKTAPFSAPMVPRCQVEGCYVALLNAKEYHRRHKVCEMHSKAPKVVVLGIEQRFCQQCSRFHVVSEFDDSKRSCRRRLAGHNERRRKSSHHSVARNSTQDSNLMVGGGGFPYLSSAGCALSLLSSRSDSWLSHADLSIRCSAALSELIAENRAALMTRQLVLDRDWHLHHQAVEDFKEIQPESNYFPQQMFP